MAGFHVSVDDVFDCLIELSDRGIAAEAQPVLGFCRQLANEGARPDLYLFRSGLTADGAPRCLDDLTDAARDQLRRLGGVRFGPHAEDYATAPHAQEIVDQMRTMQGLFAAIDRFADAEQRARWLRLHYFSECFELAPLWKAEGVEALLTTDRPAIAWRLPAAERETLRATGMVIYDGVRFVRSHLRLENFVDEAADPPRFLARIDAAVAEHGFVTLFTHEVDLADARVRTLALASVRHLVAMGATAL